jgi:hypothetical protein
MGENAPLGRHSVKLVQVLARDKQPSLFHLRIEEVFYDVVTKP